MTRRTMAARKKHATDRLARRVKFEILLARADRLSSAEADALREYALTEAATADQLRSTARGQDRAMQQMRDRLTAADAAIVEAEQDRDQAREQLAQAKRWGAVWRSHVLTVDERADRHHDAWRSARKRVRATTTELERVRGWLTHWANRARTAETALAHVQATLDAIDRDRARLSPENESFGDGYADAVARIRIALDDQPKELTP
ncbi:hypothetical protein ACFQ6B_23685 [Streptomyces wedmorensis]|uniref:Uncharacterized protein n=1 Tax=Streptomyces wedmorensis TaxID=43759 RepID=A0ABW6J7I2_STRWE